MLQFPSPSSARQNAPISQYISEVHYLQVHRAEGFPISTSKENTKKKTLSNQFISSPPQVGLLVTACCPLLAKSRLPRLEEKAAGPDLTSEWPA